jgi:hypothetical protein
MEDGFILISSEALSHLTPSGNTFEAAMNLGEKLIKPSSFSSFVNLRQDLVRA